MRFDLRVGTLIDGRGGPPLPNAVIRVEQGRIAAVEPARTLESAPDVPTLDFSGHWGLPGLVDVHAHPTFPADRRDLETNLAEPDEMLALTAVGQLTRHLHSG